MVSVFFLPSFFHNAPHNNDDIACRNHSNILKRLKTNLKIMSNNTMALPDLLYSMSRIAYAAEKLCERTYYHKLARLLKSVGNITGGVAKMGFFLRAIPGKGISSAFAGRHDDNQGPRGNNPRFANLLQGVADSHIPDLINTLAHPARRGVSVSEVVQVATDIYLISGTKNEKISFYLRIVKTTVDFFISIKNAAGNAVAAYKILINRVKESIGHAISSIVSFFCLYFFQY
ncbi:hypothetical protein [Acerihabitans arboris]|uniref:Uncharacterized protein n=1 Tax=Acerihabitans arboris TaxID=2691583 RepID=A0A845SPS5_9GAMM|nr:hypothetical protein [Acerihabitans arboris]NDL64538.1 hypothetical protein [Acerihabitans arboris]